MNAKKKAQVPSEYNGLDNLLRQSQFEPSE